MSHQSVPPVAMPATMDRDAEINRIKKELEILRARHALYARMGRVLKIFFAVWTPLFATGLLALAVNLIVVDALSGVFFLGVLLAFGLLAIWLTRLCNFRWIDLASSRVYGNPLNPCFVYPNMRRCNSDAQLIEEQIAERERRLSELGEGASGQN
jgi:hypothetical protein